MRFVGAQAVITELSPSHTHSVSHTQQLLEQKSKETVGKGMIGTKCGWQLFKNLSYLSYASCNESRAGARKVCLKSITFGLQWFMDLVRKEKFKPFILRRLIMEMFSERPNDKIEVNDDVECHLICPYISA